MTTERETKGKEIAQGAGIIEHQENVFHVPSQVSNNKYTVVKHYDYFSCNCPDYHYRRKGKKCKHIYAVLFWNDFKAQATKTEQYEELQGAAVSCVHCSSLNVVKNGVRKNLHTKKQRYLCRECKKFFVLNQEFARLKGDEKVVCTSLDLYFSGLSLKKISNHLQQFHGVKVHYSTVYRWIERFMKVINEYVATIQPEKMSYIVHTDEMKVKTKMSDWLWCWNSIDSETKFLLASTVTKKKYLSDAKLHLRQVKETLPQKPAYIFTDGLPVYRKGIKKAFNPTKGAQKLAIETKHIFNVGLQSRQSNNKIERLHGSQRERLKVMRGVNNKKALESKMESWKTYYNFVRPHEALGGKTPAEASGINVVNGSNKWSELIKKG